MIGTKHTEEDLLAAIKRSGYFLESEITKHLASLGYFVESNQSIIDPITGKSREIDLVAEYYNFEEAQAKDRTACKAHLIFEIKNNQYPLVLLTKLEFSPNIEIWESTREILTVPKGIKYDYYEGFYEELLQDDDHIYTQYCSFSLKKGNKELMATHPDALHSSISKIIQYCDEAVDRWDKDDKQEESTDDSYKNMFFRHFLYLPIILINDDLYELEIDGKKEPLLKQVQISKLLYNYHYDESPRTGIVFIVTKNGLEDFLSNMRELERKIEDKMIKAKQKSIKSK